MSIKLTDTQLVMMSAASQRRDRCFIAPPMVKAGAAHKVANKLISAGFVKEVKAKAGAPVWRRDESGQPYALKLTTAGAKAIAINEGPAIEQGDDEGGSLDDADQTAASSQVVESLPEDAIEPAPPGPSAPRAGSKLRQVIELLRQDHGATIDELIAATGWLAHTTRAALTGLRKRGYAVAIDRSDDKRGSFYRIQADEAGDDKPPPATYPDEGGADSAAVLKKAGRHSKPHARRAA